MKTLASIAVCLAVLITGCTSTTYTSPTPGVSRTTYTTPIGSHTVHSQPAAVSSTTTTTY